MSLTNSNNKQKNKHYLVQKNYFLARGKKKKKVITSQICKLIEKIKIRKKKISSNWTSQTSNFSFCNFAFSFQHAFYFLSPL